jgi:hypothetical protein
MAPWGHYSRGIGGEDGLLDSRSDMRSISRWRGSHRRERPLAFSTPPFCHRHKRLVMLRIVLSTSLSRRQNLTTRQLMAYLGLVPSRSARQHAASRKPGMAWSGECWSRPDAFIGSWPSGRGLLLCQDGLSIPIRDRRNGVDLLGCESLRPLSRPAVRVCPRDRKKKQVAGG